MGFLLNVEFLEVPFTIFEQKKRPESSCRFSFNGLRCQKPQRFD